MAEYAGRGQLRDPAVILRDRDIAKSGRMMKYLGEAGGPMD